MKNCFLSSKVISNRQLNRKFRVIKLKFLKTVPLFKPGQFLLLQVNPTTTRAYSIASSPNDLPYWQIIYDIAPAGRGVNYLTRLKSKNTVRTSSPLGRLYLKRDGSNIFLLGATGCGIASIKPIAQEIVKNKQNSRVCLFWGLRNTRDIFFKDLFSKWQNEHPNFDYQIIISQPGILRQENRGHINSYLLEKAGKLPLVQTSAYLCGNQEMVETLRTGLIKKGLSEKRIYFESYY